MSITPGGFRRRKATKMNSHEPVSVDIWDPFELEGFSISTLIPLSADTSQLGSAPMDWKETPEAHVFMADLPGVKKEEVRVEVEEEKVLKISGQRSRQSEEKGDKWHRVERSSDRFVRSVRLPPNTSTEGAKAVLEKGVLTVIVPKEQEKKSYGRVIQIAG